MTKEAGSIGEPLVGHVRQPFFELYQAHKSAVAKEALEQIAALMPSKKRSAGILPKNGARCG